MADIRSALLTEDPRSHGLWACSAPAPPPTRVLDGAAASEIAIIGAGYTGLSAALHLARHGQSVTVLEAEEIGFGGAGRNVGLVNAGMWVKPEVLMRALGTERGGRLIRLLGGAPGEVFGLIASCEIACEAQQNGTLHCAAGAAGRRDIEDRARQWQRFGAPVELLSAEETRARIGGGDYAGALLDRRAGTIQPLAFVRGLAAAAIREGAAIHTRSPVTGAERRGRDWLLRTPGGSVRANWVIASGDAYARHVWPKLRLQQIRLPFFNFATEPLPPELRRGILDGGEGCWDTRRVMNAFRTDAAGRLLFGSVGQLSGPDLVIHRSWARRAMLRAFPQLRGVAFAHEWFGQIGMTPTHLPSLHVLDKNVLAVAGYNGRGIAPGVVFGKALAEHIACGMPLHEIPLEVSLARPAALRAVREWGYRLGSGLVHMISDRGPARQTDASGGTGAAAIRKDRSAPRPAETRRDMSYGKDTR